MAAGRVLVVGSINADIALPVDRLPGPGATMLAGDPIRSSGGKGANAAVAAARDAADVRLVGAVGSDEAGRSSLAALAAEGVGTDSVAVLDDAPTGLAMICVDAVGENFIVVAAGANGRVAPEHVSATLSDLTPNDVCVVNFEVPQEAVVAADARCSAAGARLIVNPSPVRPLGTDLTAAGRVLVANAGELRELIGSHDLKAAAGRLQRSGWEAVVVTLGADGVQVFTPDAAVTAVAAFAVTVADTTGAGDTFTGVLAAGLARGYDLMAAARRATAAASLSTAGMGARSAMPKAADIDRLLSAG